MAKPQNSDNENIAVLLDKLSVYSYILEETSQKKHFSPRLKKFYSETSKKEKEVVLLEFINLYINSCYNKQDYSDIYSSKILKIINAKFTFTSDSNHFIINNFTKIIKIGFEHEKLNNALIDLIKNYIREYSCNKKEITELDDSYLWLKNEYPEIQEQLEKIRNSLDNEDLRSLNEFIDFACEAKKKIKEQNKAEELEKKRIADELSRCVKEVKYKAQPKKKNKSKNRKKIIKNQSDVNDLPKTSNDDEVHLNHDKVEHCEELLKLVKSGFPSEESEKFKKEKKQEIDDLKINDNTDQKIEPLYRIMMDFFLLHVEHYITRYNVEYGQKIRKTKDLFGTDRFNSQSNRFITSNLCNIASYIKYIHDDLKEVRIIMDELIPLIYKKQHDNEESNDQQQSEVWLEMTGCDNLKLLNEFLDDLKELGEWHNNKTQYIRKNNIRNRNKTNIEKETEQRAISEIKSCVDLLTEITSVYDKSSFEQNVDLLNVYSHSQDRIIYDEECIESPTLVTYYIAHHPWCALRDITIESMHPAELRQCSC